MLYERDYKILNEQELKQLALAKKFESSKTESGFTPEDFFTFHELMPEAGYYYESLFPNNHLHIGELDDKRRLTKIRNGLVKILDENCNERAILNYISKSKAYFIIGSILKGDFYFGHHRAYLFKEFQLPPSYKADYLIIGKNSGGYEFIFVELESPCQKITTKEGEFGETIRKGLKQIEDWDAWLDSNFSHLKIQFQSSQGEFHSLSKEFYNLDKTRIHYAVIAGRRTHYNDKTYRLRRRLKERNRIHLLHYDNLLDNTDRLIRDGNY